MKKTLVLVLIVAMGSGVVFANTVTMPPFTYAGRVMNYMRVPYASGVTVYARNTNGVLLARASVITSESSSRNYVLPVPMASVRTAQTAVAGDPILIEVDDGRMLWTGLQITPQEPIGNPGTVTMADIVLAYDSNENGVADEYESMIESLRFESEGVYSPYGPASDYDGDGVSNYAEYIAGTDPLSAAEVFAINFMDDLAPTIDIQGSRVVIRFYAMRGRTYSVAAVDDLTGDPQWENHAFRLVDAPDAPVSKTYISPTAVEEEGNVTLYLDAGTRMRTYFRLRVQ